MLFHVVHILLYCDLINFGNVNNLQNNNIVNTGTMQNINVKYNNYYTKMQIVKLLRTKYIAACEMLILSLNFKFL